MVKIDKKTGSVIKNEEKIDFDSNCDFCFCFNFVQKR